MTASERALIDSNLLVYWFDASEPVKHAKANSFMRERFVAGDSCVSAQNLAEFHSAVTGKIARVLAGADSKMIVEKLAKTLQVFTYGARTVVAAIDLQARYRAPFWDALLVATMEENGIRTIYTENTKDFEKIPWLKVINPLA